MYNQQNKAEAVVAASIAQAQGHPRSAAPDPAVHSPGLSGQKQLDDVDFQWRPACLENVPWYFFAAMTEAVSAEVASSKVATLPWFSRLKEGSTWVTRPGGTVLRSRHFPDEVLHSGASTHVLVQADLYCRVQTGQAWCVPVILGRFPKTPTDVSTHEEKGRFALFMMLLFKPWRRLKKDILSCLFKQDSVADTNPWQLLYAEYERWFAEM